MSKHNTSQATDPEVQDILNSIANDIERNGHYQGRLTVDEYGGPLARCCVVSNATMARIRRTPLEEAVLDELRRRMGNRPIAFNDTYPTEVVLETLRRPA